LWSGPKSIANTKETVELLRKLGKRVFFMTNNATLSRTQYMEKFKKRGFAAQKVVFFRTHYSSFL